jgi:hypothetical protein
MMAGNSNLGHTSAQCESEVDPLPLTYCPNYWHDKTVTSPITILLLQYHLHDSIWARTDHIFQVAQFCVKTRSSYDGNHSQMRHMSLAVRVTEVYLEVYPKIFWRYFKMVVTTHPKESYLFSLPWVVLIQNAKYQNTEETETTWKLKFNSRLTGTHAKQLASTVAAGSSCSQESSSVTLLDSRFCYHLGTFCRWLRRYLPLIHFTHHRRQKSVRRREELTKYRALFARCLR